MDYEVGIDTELAERIFDNEIAGIEYEDPVGSFCISYLLFRQVLLSARLEGFNEVEPV